MTPNENEGKVGSKCVCLCWPLYEGLRLGFGWKRGEKRLEGSNTHLKGLQGRLYVCSCVCVHVVITGDKSVMCYQSPYLSCSHTHTQKKSALGAPGVNKHS